MNEIQPHSCHVGIIPVVLVIASALGCGGAISDPAPGGYVSATQNPLVAEYIVAVPHADASAWVEFGTDTSYGRQTSTAAVTSRSWQNLSILVAGMRANTTYHMRAHVQWYGGNWTDQDRPFTTGSLPTTSDGTTPLTRPAINVTLPTPGLTPSPGVELFALIEPSNTNMLRAFVTDLQGNIIWYFDPGPNRGSPVPIKLLQNGHFILDVGDLLEVDLAGRILRDVSYPQINQSLQARGYSFSIIAFHHDVLVLPNGHWIVLCNLTKDFTDLPGFPGVTHVLGDALVDIDTNGNVIWAWSAFDHLDVNRHPLGLADFQGLGADWTHSNAIVYTGDGDLLLSMRNQSWILKIDYQNGTGTGSILWKLGLQGDFEFSEAASQWFYGQHDPDLLASNGSKMTLAIWDNGNARLDADNQPCGFTNCYSRATIFEIDQDAKMAQLVWEYLPGFFSSWGGSIDMLANGDIEFDQCTPFDSAASRIVEVTQGNESQTVWQLDLAGENAYRAFRIPSLYPGVIWK